MILDRIYFYLLTYLPFTVEEFVEGDFFKYISNDGECDSSTLVDSCTGFTLVNIICEGVSLNFKLRRSDHDFSISHQFVLRNVYAFQKDIVCPVTSRVKQTSHFKILLPNYCINIAGPTSFLKKNSIWN